jgi:hypothetical protein
MPEDLVDLGFVEFACSDRGHDRPTGYGERRGSADE